MNIIKRGFGFRFSFLVGVLSGMAGGMTDVYAQSCAPVPSGLVGWWRAEGNAEGAFATNNAYTTNGVTYGVGKVGQAFQFDGVNDAVIVPRSAALDVGKGNGMTVEGWVKPTDDRTATLVEWVDTHIGDPYGAHIMRGIMGVGYLYVNMVDINGAYHIFDSGKQVMPVDVLTHVAVTYDKSSGFGRMYANGALVHEINLGSFDAQTSYDIYLGYRPANVPFGPIAYAGQIDEFAVYSRALAAEEIQSIYSAGAGGKCVTPEVANINAQPQNQSVIVGGNTSFSVVAGGTQPVTYQWLFNGEPIAGATGSTLTLGNVQFAQAGQYSVTVSNSLGGEVSSNAVLTVNWPPTPMRIAGVTANSGGNVAVPIVATANGIENTLSFSVAFDKSLFSYLSAQPAEGLPPGSSLNIETGTIGDGRLGLSLSLPTGTALAAGTQVVAVVNFTVAAVTNATISTVSFADAPTTKSILGTQGQPLLATYESGRVTVQYLHLYAQPQNRAAYLGDTVVFNVGASGTMPLTYQWLFNGSAIAAATNATLTLSNVQFAQAGLYSVAVANVAGELLSATAELAVAVAPFTGVANGSFESGLNNWTASGVLVQNSSGTDGTRAAIIGPYDTPNASLSQTVRVLPGTNYYLKFASAANATSAGKTGVLQVVVRASGQTLADEKFRDVSPSVIQGTNGFTYHSLTFTTPLDAYSIVLQFIEASPNGGRGVDNLVDDVVLLQGVLGEVPVIVVQPQSKSVDAGGTVTFGVLASGTPPLSYQWRLNSFPLTDATNASLTLNNVQVAQAGDYSVAVSNIAGVATSSNAVLIVIPPPPCASPAVGLVGWWRAEGDAIDSIGTNNGIVSNGAFTQGKVGLAYTMDGSTAGYVKIPASRDLDVGQDVGFSVEAWIKPSDASGGRPIVEWSPPSAGSPYGVHFWLGHPWSQNCYLSANLLDSNGQAHDFYYFAPIPLNVYQHVGLSYDKASGIARMYVNGAVVQESSLGTFTPRTSFDFYIGRRPPGDGNSRVFSGQIDEISLYNRALTPQEISVIYLAGSSGKCGIPQPPSILTQPQDQVVVVGGSTVLNVVATGTAPLGYQWLFNGVTISGATNTFLALNNIETAQAGTYAVTVSNAIGFAVSSNAILSVNLPPPCTAPAVGLVAWWRAEGSPSSYVDANDAVLSGGATYSPGLVGQAFNLDGVDDSIIVPAASNLAVKSLTIELWVYPKDITIARPLVEYAGATGVAAINFWQATLAPGSLYALFRGNEGNALQVSSAANILKSNQWSHVALTFDYATRAARLYLNGTSVASNSTTATVTPRTDLPVNIGYRPTGSAELLAGRRIAGKLDEVSIYDRALTAAEIQAIYAAGISGKCTTPQPPSIVTQPLNKTVTAGSNVSFSVVASGTAPLSYQWLFNDAPMIEATTATLALSNVQFAQAGNYSVVISNAAGTVTSSNAVLTVQHPPSPVWIGPSGAAAGMPVTVPIYLGAQGIENTLRFSLMYAGEMLSFSAAAAGAGLPEGTVVTADTTALAQGKLGVSVALPSGATVAVGTQAMALVTFNVAAIQGVASASLAFGDTPTAKQVLGAEGQSLQATYQNGNVTILRTHLAVARVIAAADGLVDLPVQIVSQGNENALGFSLQYDPALLTFLDARLAEALPADATLIVNTNEGGAGRVGVAIALPTDALFTAGTQQVVVATFLVAPVQSPVTIPVTFGDQPTVRQVSDRQARALPALYVPGQVQVASIAFESDVAPRPGGDAALTIIDWVQMGRFVAGLDPVESGEFQQADCAPRSSRGNGMISITDWVQAGRYAAGLDPRTLAGGPTERLAMSPPPPPVSNAGTSPRKLSFPITNIAPGSAVTVAAQLEAVGDENALGFSVAFDAARLRYTGAAKGASAGAATLNVNTNQLGAGRLGIALALPVNSTLSAGSAEVVLLSFTAADATGNNALMFEDQPVLREVSSTVAEPLPCTYENGAVVIETPVPVGPPLTAKRSGSSLIFLWPATATGFELEWAPAVKGAAWTKVGIDPIPVGDQWMVVTPMPGTQGYFRLHKP